MPIEKNVENQIKEYLTKENIYYHKNHGNTFSKLGIPDIEGCFQGRYFGLEIKRKDKYKISLAQIKNGIKIVSNNGIFAFTNDINQVVELIEDIKNNKKKPRHSWSKKELEKLLDEQFKKLKNQIGELK